MTVRLLHSIQSAALRAQCLREVFAFTGQWPDKRAIILVPEQAKLDFEQAYLQQSGSAGLLMAEVLSFRRLSARLNGEAGRIAGPLLDKTGQAMLLYRLLAETRAELRSYARLADKPGFIRQIMAVLGDLRRYQIDAAALSALVDQIADKTLQSKVNDLALLLERYDQAVRDLGFHDPETELDRLVELLSQPQGLARTRLDWLSRTSVWVAGFGELRNFTPQEYAVLDQLAQHCEQMTVTVLSDCIPGDELAVEQGPDLFLPGRRTAYQLQQRYRPGRPIRVEPDWSADIASLARYLGAPAEWTAQAHITTLPGLSGSEKPQAEVTQSQAAPEQAGKTFLNLVLAHQPDDQATWLAGEIRRLVQEEGYRYRDLVVAVCDPAQDLPRLQAAFNTFKIPLFLDQVRLLAGTALIRTILAVLDLSSQGFSRLTVMRALRAGLLAEDQGQVDEFENYVLARGLFHLERLMEPQAEEPQVLDHFRQTILIPIRDLADRMKSAETGLQKVAALAGYLDAAGLQQRTSQLILRLHQEHDSESALAIAKSWNALTDVLAQLVRFAGQAPMDLKTFRDLLAAGLDNADSGVLPTALDQVAIGNLAHARQRTGRILFLYNTRASVFPPGAPPEGLLKDSDRQSLSSLLGQVLPSNARDQVFADAAMIFGLLTLPTDHLVMLAPNQDASPYIQRLREWSGQNLLLLPDRMDPADVRLLAPAAAQNGLIQMVHQSLADWPHTLDPFRPLALALQQLGYPLDQTIAHLRQPDTLQLQIEPQLVQARFGPVLQLSVSQLEKYAACPFSHLAAHGIVLRERDIYEPQATDSGTFLHTLAERSLALLQGELGQLPDEIARKARIEAWLAGDLDGALTRVMAELRSDKRVGLFFSPGLRASAGRRLERVARTSIAALLRQLLTESFTPALFEWVFEPGRGNALTLDLTLGRTVQLNGKVDRVDWQMHEGQRQFRVIDYKSGSQSIQYDALYHGLHLQLPAYLAAFAHSHPDQTAVDACYFRFDQPILRQSPEEVLDPGAVIHELDKRFALQGLDLPLDQLDRLQLHVQEKIRSWALAIVRGAFAAKPSQLPKADLPCVYCAYPSVCGFDQKKDPCQRFFPLGHPKTNDLPRLSGKEDFMARLEQAYPDAGGGGHAAD
jgi:ATP-dependent helicase/nuclease subunit B